ncbi:MAG: hypothetical protein RBR75_06430 [Acholeplasmataceae bacterium]|jgi:hypothetical protein|nr:hypothetical protein [Acholeplasmataceae bacterium]
MDKQQLDQLKSILKYFHELIIEKINVYRMQGTIKHEHIKYPSVDDLLKTIEMEDFQRGWFPIQGMYGGFAYRLVNEEGSYVLYTSNWSRVNEGSEEDHKITSQGTFQTIK